MTFLDEYAEYYDVLYNDKDYISEARFIETLLDRYVPGAKRILELGCGTGIHAALLAEKGFSIHGVDMSSSMIEKAQERRRTLRSKVSDRLKFSQDDMRSFKTESKYNAVISLFHAVNYLDSNEDLRGAFNTASAHLRSQGVFIFDSWYGPTVLNDRPVPRVKRKENEELVITRISEPELRPDENCVVVDYTFFVKDKKMKAIKEFKEKHRMRYLFMPEVKQLFEDQGMQIIAAREWMTDREPGIDTFGVYFVGKAD